MQSDLVGWMARYARGWLVSHTGRTTIYRWAFCGGWYGQRYVVSHLMRAVIWLLLGCLRYSKKGPKYLDTLIFIARDTEHVHVPSPDNHYPSFCTQLRLLTQKRDHLSRHHKAATEHLRHLIAQADTHHRTHRQTIPYAIKLSHCSHLTREYGAANISVNSTRHCGRPIRIMHTSQWRIYLSKILNTTTSFRTTQFIPLVMLLSAIVWIMYLGTLRLRNEVYHIYGSPLCSPHLDHAWVCASYINIPCA